MPSMSQTGFQTRQATVGSGCFYNQSDGMSMFCRTALRLKYLRRARMLAGVGARLGKNSDEYEKAGGVRPKEIRRSKKASKDGGKS